MYSAKTERLHGLDTLRAVAIVAVMIFHLRSFLPDALAPVANVGWMGVDLFFVLSGFLIGSQVLKPVSLGGRLDLSEFYRRRAFRILPAYLVVLLLYLVVPAWREQPGLPAAWKFLSFTANLVMDYPAQLAFSHSWSLCVEEHFYLLLPCLVLLWRKRRPSAVQTSILIAAVVLLGVALRAWELFHVVRAPGLGDDAMSAAFMKRIYYPTYTRLDGLVSGVGLACVRIFRPAWWARISRSGAAVFCAGLVVSGAAIWLFHGEYPSPDRTASILFGFPLLACGFGLLVAAGAAERGPLRVRVLGAGALAALAFSLYLTHKEVAHLCRICVPWMERNTGWAAAAVYGASCLAAAASIYWCVERPFLRLRDGGGALNNARIRPLDRFGDNRGEPGIVEGT